MTLVFTDIHFGLKLNTEVFLNIAQQNVEWIIQQVKENSVDNVIFCGDWFHQRSSVSVNTLHKSYESLKQLASKVKNLYLIVGNHDSYYKNTIKVHSLKTFEQFDNVHIIEEPTMINLHNKEALLVPWGVPTDELKKYSADIMFGHFEPGGVRVHGQMMENSECSPEDLTSISPIVFSGHYHSYNNIKTNNGRRLVFVGSPSQQNWGDVDEQRGIIIFDESKPNLDVRFIENDIAPKFKKISYSKLIDKSANIKSTDIKNNFVKIIVDCPYKFDTVQQLIIKLNKFEPLSVEAEYLYSEQIGAIISNSSGDNIKTHEDYIKEFIMEEGNTFPTDINREKLLSLALSIYKKVQEKENDQPCNG